MNRISPPRRRPRRRLLPVLLLIAAVLVVGALLTAVVLSLRGGSARQEPEADPHAGQVYINDGFNMVWMTPHEGIPASGLAQEDFRRDTNDDGSDGVRVRYLGAEYATRWGVDVSNHQGTIDWAALKRQGIDFAYLRLGLRGYGEKGSLYPDRSFDSYYSGARAAGIEACEAYVSSRDSFRAMTTEGEVVEYESNLTRGLGFRGLYRGRMGYASTEAFDEEAVGQLVRGVMESAELCEDEDEAPLYDGGEPVPDMDLRSPALAQVTPQEKIDRVLAMEKLVKESDPRIDKTAHNVINTGSYTVRIVNSHGMDRSYTEDVCALYGQATAKDGDFVSSSGYGVAARSFDGLDVQKVGGEVARRTLDGLNAAPVPSGKYRVVFFSEAMCDLLGVFSSIFSAETAQKGMSLLKGRVGERIAAPCVTLVDDPLMEGGMGSRPFDDEGVPSATHTVVEDGVFRTFLHNLKTARKDGVATTGNARKVGYASAVHVTPTNFYLKPGKRTLDDMLRGIGEGLVITEVSGLHAGANPISGDFSLLAKGYTFREGRREKPVEQITVAGNFYELLSAVRELASDLTFPMGGIGCPSVDVGELSVSGT